jgi:F-type H+-transporting ATPase subunit gamma
MRDWQSKGAKISMCLIGSKATAFFRRLPNPVLANTQGLGDQPRMKDLIGTVKVMLGRVQDGKIDRLLLGEFALREHDDAEARSAAAAAGRADRRRDLQDHWDYIYEPDASRSSTACSCATSKSQVIAAPWKTSPAKWRRA